MSLQICSHTAHMLPPPRKHDERMKNASARTFTRWRCTTDESSWPSAPLLVSKILAVISDDFVRSVRRYCQKKKIKETNKCIDVIVCRSNYLEPLVK
ncbi:hypothetical protein CEXT_246551 [Caerostris extrusa]|uniref:Uncharacterized protein n=1 Tax=Caerostris extrusa TaxID=172846 RepID=A0AAV4Q018_CAEEX|nr:hypothetical protein CEXT_246551 [Caerostris extrusa]